MTTDLAKADATFHKRWEEGQYERAQQYDLFPLVLQERIDGFLERRPDTFWKIEPAEFFCCSEAVKIINHLGTVEEIRAYATGSRDGAQRLIPEVDYGMHSEHTFIQALTLAVLYRQDPTQVPRAHSVVCELLGCEVCGCWAAIAEKN